VADIFLFPNSGPNYSGPVCTYAYRIKVQYIARPLYGGIRLPLAIGAVVDLHSVCQTPDSGQIEPVFTFVPIGFIFTSPQISLASQIPRWYEKWPKGVKFRGPSGSY